MAALRIDEGEPKVEEGVQKFFDLLTRLEGADLNYSDLQKKTKLLALLPDSSSSLIINLNRDLPRLSLEDVKREILQEDFRRRKLAGPDGAGVASMGRGHGRGRGRGRGGRFGSSNFSGGRGNGGYGSNNNNGYGRGRGRFDGECHFCHKTGHMWRDCFRLPDGWTPSQGQEGRGARGGRGRGRGGCGGHGGEAASMKGGDYDKDSSEDRYPGHFFFVSTQAAAAAGGVDGFEEPATVGKEVMLKLQDKFKCKTLGDVNYYLGLHIERDVEKRWMRVHQKKYLETLAASFGKSEGHGAIALAKNPVLHGLTKHMKVKWHWVRSMVTAGEVELHYVKTTA
ncbi:hypothetical protein CLOM_g12092 [Closterium sp. NIES-68]|nr:hypothetical protein CLOM_g12092 [Closterium sp. NIES-68]